MWLRQIAMAAFALAALAVPASAQEPAASHLAAARELVLIGGASGSIDTIMPAIMGQIRQQSITRPEMTKDLEDVFKMLQPEMEQQRQIAVTIAARAYAKWMTEPEIKDTLVFFRTPSGAKYIKVLADLTDEIVNGVTEWSQSAGEYVMTRVRSEMGKRGHQMQ